MELMTKSKRISDKVLVLVNSRLFEAKSELLVGVISFSKLYKWQQEKCS